MNANVTPLLEEIEKQLQPATDTGLSAVLGAILRHFDCAVGTIHVLDDSGLLQLRAQQGIPAGLLDRMSTVPIGKGMAGLAAERREPVQVCNLQTTTSGDVRPAAKQTGMEGSVAVPMIADGVLRGVLGVAKPVVHDWTPAELESLLSLGSAIARRV